MTDAAATFQDVTFFDGRVFARGECRKILRRLLHTLFMVVGSVAAVGAVVATVMLAAAWIVRSTLRPYAHVNVPFAVAEQADRFGGLTIAAHVDVAPPLPPASTPSTAGLDALLFDAKWARAAASIFTVNRPEAIVLKQGDEPSNDVRREIASTSDSTRVAALSPAAVPADATSPTLIPDPIEIPPLPPSRPTNREPTRLPRRDTPRIAMATPDSTTEGSIPKASKRSLTVPRSDSRTAVYDIAASTVYLPNGETLEAHSGLGDKMDDPRYVHVRMRGPTPPNVYDLRMREALFHGVEAIRLTPVDNRKMFGRDGMLAHTYMLGPNGQSNGCVSFKDYRRFLAAFKRGEVDRLVVVPRLGNASWQTVSASPGMALGYADSDR